MPQRQRRMVGAELRAQIGLPPAGEPYFSAESGSE
jgi:hypothetical protein